MIHIFSAKSPAPVQFVSANSKRKISSEGGSAAPRRWANWGDGFRVAHLHKGGLETASRTDIAAPVSDYPANNSSTNRGKAIPAGSRIKCVANPLRGVGSGFTSISWPF